MQTSQRRKESLVQAFAKNDLPAWVSHFDGPLADPACDKAQVVRSFLTAGDLKAALLQYSERHMQEKLSNIVVPTLGYNEGRPEIRLTLLVGDPADAARLAELNPAKDEGNFPFPVTSVPTQPDAAKWRAQRQGLTPAFLPHASLAPMVPILQEGVAELLQRWERLGVVEAHRELHHFTLDLFLRGMCGVRGLLPTDPEASAKIREAFNLESLPDPKEIVRTMPARMEFAQKLLEAPGDGPLLQRLRGIEDAGQRTVEAIAFLVAGHDTTAHTLQWVLLELARRPEVQQACREEAEDLLANGLPRHEDLPRFERTTAVIAETLRLWGPAWFVFGRRLSADVVVKGRTGPTLVPAGTALNFWYYGQHHSPAFWGADADEFQPFKRGFTDEELQRGSFRTPCSRRFHPFSLPPRDCLGKNFSLMEMRLLLPQLLLRFSVGLAEPSKSAVRDLECGRGEAFMGRARMPGPVKPPPEGELWLTLTPRMSPSSRL